MTIAPPSGLNATSRVPVCTSDVSRRRLVFSSRTSVTFPRVTARNSPSALVATLLDRADPPAAWSELRPASRPGSTSQTRALPSVRDIVARSPPAPKKTRLTGPACPRSTSTERPLEGTQTRAVPSMLEVATRFPFWANATPRTPPL